MNGGERTVPGHAALCFEYAEAFLEAVEKMIGCREALGAACARLAPDDDDLFDALLVECGAADLGEVLGILAGRILTGLHGECVVPYSMGREPWRAEEARAAVAGIAARYEAAR